MAMETAMSKSSYVTQTIAKYYDKLFLRIAEANLVHKQLGQLNRKIEQGAGGAGTGLIAWTKWTNLPLVTAGQGEGYPTTAVSMTATQVTATPAQYDAAVSVSDILAYSSFGDIMKEAVSRLAYNAGLSIDTVIRNAIVVSGTTQNATGVAAAAWTTIPVTGYLYNSEVRKAARTLRRNDAFKQDDGYFVAVAHSDALYDLMGDTTTGGWITANTYTEGNVDKLLKGEVGRIHGVRFLETSNGYVRSNSGVVASGSIYTTGVFAKDAFGVTELQGLETFVKGFGSAGAADPTNKIATAGWKAMFAVAQLNSAFHVAINHTVSTTA